jgi:hypothetical protein
VCAVAVGPPGRYDDQGVRTFGLLCRG